LLTYNEFVDAFVRFAAQAAPALKIAAAENQKLSVRNADGAQLSLSLENAYEFYRKDPDELQAILERVLGMTQLKTRDLYPDQLVAMVRDQSWPGSQRRQLTDGLVAVVAADLGDQYAYPTDEKLAEIGLTLEQAFDVAISNVDRRIGELSMGENSAGFRIFFSSNDISSSLIFSDGFRKAMANMWGEAAYLPAARNILLVTSVTNDDALKEMRRLAETNREPHPITDRPICCRDGKWIEL
jgi:hypothetical protein